MEGKDGDAPRNEIELVFDPVAHAAADAEEKGVASLPWEVRQQLYRLGCRF